MGGETHEYEQSMNHTSLLRGYLGPPSHPLHTGCAMLYIYVYTLSLLCGRVYHSNTDHHYMDEISNMHTVVEQPSSKQAQGMIVVLMMSQTSDQSCHLHLLCHDITVTSWNEVTCELFLQVATVATCTPLMYTHTHSVNVSLCKQWFLLPHTRV